MLRQIFALLAAVSLATAVNAEPLQPTGKWTLFYEQSSCVAERAFDDYRFGFQPSPLGLTTRFVIQGPGKASRAKQYNSSIWLSDGGPPIKTTGLLYPLSTKGRRAMITILSSAEAERVAKSNRLAISTGGTGEAQFMRLPETTWRMSADFATGPTGKLSIELARCMEDLRRHWGMVDGKFPAPAKSAQADIRGIFTPDDYPHDAMSANQAGSTRYMLMVDEKGGLLDCVVTESSGIASLDWMGCQVIRERAKIKPATDANGKPVKDIVLTPPVRWSLSN